MRSVRFAAFLLASALGNAAAGFTFSAHVVGIIDGDTVTVLDQQARQYRIRLQAIDAPELGQAFGMRAKLNLSGRIYKKRVDVDVIGGDRYKRLVARVIMDGRDVGLEQVQAGYAWVYVDFEGELSRRDRARYEEAQRSAKAARIGLWSDPHAIPPWQFRRHHKDRGAETTASEARGVGAVVGNRRTHIYHRPDCPDYERIAVSNRVQFSTEAEAVAAGYRLARNCP